MGAAKDKFKSLSWKVKYYNCNDDKIEDYDILKYHEDFIKKLKKNCETKEEFAEELRRDMKWKYWSKCECELIILLTDDNRVILMPWCGAGTRDKVGIDVTNDTTFDWLGFARHHIGRRIDKNAVKIDIYDQLCYGDQFEKLVDYCWYTRLKYQRDHQKFHK